MVKYNLTKVSDDKDEAEYERLRKDTMKFNQQLTGDAPDHLIIMKDASKNIKFYEKFKALVTNNSLLEAHLQAVPLDEDVIVNQPIKENDGSSDDESSPSMSRTRDELMGHKLPPDIDVIIARICQQHKFFPVMSVLQRILNQYPGKVIDIEIFDFVLDDCWSKIILESLRYNKVLQRKNVTKITLSNNKMSSENFS